MSFTDAFRALNRLKRRRLIKDYAVIGAVASTAYMEPTFTEDIDIIVLVDTDDEYLQTFRGVAEAAESSEGMHHFLAGVPVQLFLSTTNPLFEDALAGARPVRIGGLRVKFASREHLILLYLDSFRPKDRLRIIHLLPHADMDIVHSLMERFDDEKGSLARNLQTLLRAGLS